MAEKKTPKIKFLFDESERRFHILTAFKLYSAEMYLANKASTTAKMKCSKCKTILERKVGELLEDYESAQGLSVLFETVAVFEPNLYTKIKAGNISEGIADIITYLTGEDVSKPKDVSGVIREIKPAIQASDLVNKDKVVVTKTIPKDVKKGGKKGTGKK